MKIQHQIVSRSPSEFLYQLVEVFCHLGMDEKYRLADKEIHFFVGCVQLQQEGIPLDSQLATERLAKLYPESKDGAQRVYQYRMKLKRKRWLTEERGQLKIHPFFDFSNHKDPWDVHLHLNMKYKNNGSTPSLNASAQDTA